MGEVFKVPFTDVRWYFMAWMSYCLVTGFPGFILWFCTFGGFRYWYLSDKVLDHLLKKDLQHGSKR